MLNRKHRQFWSLDSESWEKLPTSIMTPPALQPVTAIRTMTPMQMARESGIVKKPAEVIKYVRQVEISLKVDLSFTALLSSTFPCAPLATNCSFCPILALVQSCTGEGKATSLLALFGAWGIDTEGKQRALLSAWLCGFSIPALGNVTWNWS